jgi:hypothetical protein
MGVCTIHIGSASCPETKAGGWAASISSSGLSIVEGGPFRIRVGDEAEAALAAAANSLSVAAKLGYAKRGDTVILKSDYPASSSQAQTTVAARALAAAAEAIALRNGLIVISGERDNSRAAGMAKRSARFHMETARSLSSRIPDPVTIARPAIRCGEGPPGSPGSYVISEPGNQEACSDLTIRRPLRLERPGNSVLEIALSLWSSGYMRREQFRRTVAAAAGAVRSSPPAWEELCAQTGLAYGRKESRGVDAEQAADWIIDAVRQGRAGMTDTMRSLFDRYPAAHTVAWKEVASSIRLAGFDALYSDSPSGGLIPVDSGQIRAREQIPIMAEAPCL